MTRSPKPSQINFTTNYDCEVYSQEELSAKLQPTEFPWLHAETTPCGHHPYEGFHYFTSDSLGSSLSKVDHNPRFVVASIKDDPSPQGIVGVLHALDYPDSTPYTAIQFIDVRKDMKRQYVATSLLQTLNQVVLDSDFLVGSMLSKEGVQADLNDVIRKHVTRCTYFDSVTDMFRTLR